MSDKPRPFRAHFDSTCGDCHQPIHAGDLLVKGPHGWSIHSDCWPEPEFKGAAETVCPRCFLTACDCDM